MKNAIYNVLFKLYNIIPNMYPWPYLISTSDRGKILLNIIKPHLKFEDSFLDIMCGYSPLAGPLIESGYRITGFDLNQNPIKHLRKHFPEGQWCQTSYEQARFEAFSVLILLGAYELCLQPSFQRFLLNLLRLNNPRLFFLEASKGDAEAPTKEKPFADPAITLSSPHLLGYNSVISLLLESGYIVLEAGEYHAGVDIGLRVFEPTMKRIYAIMCLPRASLKGFFVGEMCPRNT